MAIRKKLRHDQRTRDSIQATQLVKRLAKHALGEVDMSSSQVQAAQTLLRKVLPDLQATAITNDAETSLMDVLREATEAMQEQTRQEQTKQEQNRQSSGGKPLDIDDSARLN